MRTRVYGVRCLHHFLGGKHNPQEHPMAGMLLRNTQAEILGVTPPLNKVLAVYTPYFATQLFVEPQENTLAESTQPLNQTNHIFKYIYIYAPAATRRGMADP